MTCGLFANGVIGCEVSWDMPLPDSDETERRVGKIIGLIGDVSGGFVALALSPDGRFTEFPVGECNMMATGGQKNAIQPPPPGFDPKRPLP